MAGKELCGIDDLMITAIGFSVDSEALYKPWLFSSGKLCGNL